jgi:hypothetical protein
VVDALYADQSLIVIDPVHDAVVAAPGCVSPDQLEMKRATDAMRIGGESAVDELGDGRDNFLG